MVDSKQHEETGGLFGYPPKELYSDKFYQDRELFYSDLIKYSKHCNNIYGEKQRTRLKDLCKRVLKYLEQSTKWEENKNEYDECILLNYWLYDKISKYFANDKDYIDIAYGSIQGIWRTLVDDSYQVSYYKKCKPLFEKILKHSDWKKGKELYDYCINYKYIEQMCPYYDKKCVEYCKYIEKKRYLYDHFDNVCTRGESSCPSFYEKCKDYNPNVVLNTLKCHEKMKAERVVTSKVSATHYPSGKEQASGTPVIEITPDTSHIGTKLGHSVLGVTPVLLTASVLYKYTPIGSWIRNLGGTRTNSIGDVVGGETVGFLANPQESADMLFGDTQNYISYQPM
ncbi:PIR protein [Plasmodium ovale]|uniref:PIR Superfamily Protein n=2 Tax=Plasmodium ovale TaxID=36330 RepID=A0A1A8XFH0_PLAOA|nr:PIR Superfamily Protein [Plasmodium ovale curtisi]SBT02647.1 PIR Superfamily Protein [Plasmodium ovale curtisi]SBT84185.1 PIR protein [Plasmodium ovale]